MELDEVLRILHSHNRNEILKVINMAVHADCEDYPRDAKFIHTGFICKTHKGKDLAFIYCVNNKQLYFQGSCSIPLLGAYMEPNQSAAFYHRWITIKKAQPSENSFPYFQCVVYNQDNDSIKLEEIEFVEEKANSHFVAYGLNKKGCYKLCIIKNNNISYFDICTSNPILTFHYGNNNFI